MFNACIIYTHTSMWPTQRLDTAPDYTDDLSRAASTVLQIVSDTSERGQLDHRFVMFPLLMAGVAVGSASDKMLVQDLMRSFEQESFGSNTRATRKLLEAVYEQQNRSSATLGHSLDVDWIGVLGEMGHEMVILGL